MMCAIYCEVAASKQQKTTHMENQKEHTLDDVAVARKRWNDSADQFNQWEELGGDEKSALIEAVRASK